jgi:non-ribosomal peptide synthase protein (TIGR01720 family)
MLADQPQIRAQLDYWRSIQSETIGPLPVSRRGPNLESSAETVAATLDCDTTAELLRLSPSRYRARFADVLLAAVVHQIARSTNALRLLLHCESHGREAEGTLDLSHVTGWFTAMYPLAFSPGSTFAQALADVRRRIREVPMQGIGFGMLRYCCSDAGIRHSLAQGRAPEVLFNYLGQFDDAVRSVPWFRYIPDQSMASYGPTNPRAHVWQIFGAVLNGEFRLQWTFSHNLHDRTTIETLAGNVIETLRRAASDTSVAALTPEDFPDADLTREDLRVIVQGHG